MTILVAGASGATGKRLVEQLIKTGQNVKIIVRPTGKIPDAWTDHPQISIIRANISEIGPKEMADHLKDCRAVASCLGHNLTLRGIYGKPRRLVFNAVRTLCDAIRQNSPQKPVRFVLMNTTGNRNRDADQPRPLGEKLVIGLVRALVPPHPDNEKAAEHLRTAIGKNNPFIEWAAVRPDSLIEKEEVTEYTLHASPTRSPIFDPGKTSRINVADFMARLITEDDLWDQWKGQMPVIYNSAD